MAFEGFLQKDQGRSKLRAITVGTSVAVHIIALVAGVAHTLWHVDELAPPNVPVMLQFRTLASLSSQAPNAAKPLGAKPAVATAGRTSPVLRRPTRPADKPALVAPVVPPPPTEPRAQPTTVAAAAPHPEPASPGTAESPKSGGVSAGAVLTDSGGGVGVGGSSSGGAGLGIAAVTPAPAPRFLPEAMSRAQRVGGTEPEFPPSLAKAGVTYVIQTKICVNTQGTVDSVQLMRKADPTLDANVNTAVHGWRYRPLVNGGHPVPFCTFVRFEFRGQ